MSGFIGKIKERLKEVDLEKWLDVFVLHSQRICRSSAALVADALHGVRKLCREALENPKARTIAFWGSLTSIVGLLVALPGLLTGIIWPVEKPAPTGRLSGVEIRKPWRTNPRLSADLIEACRREDFDKAYELLKAGAPAGDKDNSPSGSALTPLIAACEKRNLRLVHLLLDYGADANVSNGDGRTPILVAAESSEYDIASELLKRVTKNGVNVRDRLGRTATIVSCQKKNCGVLSLLLNKDPDLNLTDKSGWTALMYAAAIEGNYYCVGELIDHGADPDKQCPSSGRTALMIACEKGCPYNVEALIKKGANLNLLDNEGNGALSLAAAGSNFLPIVKQLVEGGSDPKSWPADLLPQAMQQATEWDHSLVRSLVERKCKVNGSSRNGKTALMIAADKGWTDLGRFLIHWKADVDIRDAAGQTPLMVACQKGATEFIEMLLQAASNVNAVDKKGNTPLMKAAAASGYWVAEKILAKGAKVNTVADDGASAILIACRRGEPNMVNLLLKHGAKLDPNSREAEKALFDAVGNQGYDAARRLLDRGVSPAAKNTQGFAPILVAAQRNNSFAVKDLLEHGADVNVRSPAGRTALIEAACAGCETSARELLERKDIDLHVVDDEGETALSCARKRGYQDIVTAIEKRLRK